MLSEMKKKKVHEEHKQKAPKKINLTLIVVSTSKYEKFQIKKVS